MKIDACFELGYVIKKHGFKGEVSVLIDADQPENYIELESVFVEIDQKLVPFFIEDLSLHGDRAVIKFEDIDSIEGAEDLKGCKLFLPLEALPKLDGNKFYFHEVIGFQVIDKDQGKIGEVKDVIETNAHPLLSVDYNSQEILIPISDDIIKNINREDKAIDVELPDGLIEIYTS